MTTNIRSQELNIPDEAYAQGVAAKVPYAYLWGTQGPEEYSCSKQKKIRAAYNQHGPRLLEENPTFAAFYTNQDSSCIFIIDGHHRIREAPNHDIVAIPTWIFTIAVLAEVFEKDPQNYEESLHIGSDRALRKFDMAVTASGKEYQQPIPLGGVTSFDEFKQVIAKPNQFDICALPMLKHLSVNGAST